LFVQVLLYFIYPGVFTVVLLWYFGVIAVLVLIAEQFVNY